MEALDDNAFIAHKRRSQHHPAHLGIANDTTSQERHYHIHHLPEEILFMVFSFILLEDRYGICKSQRATLMLVCKLWTRIVAESPFFWTAVHWKDGPREWEHSFAHSKGLPFTIDCHEGDSRSHFARPRISALMDWAISKSVQIRIFRIAHEEDVQTWASVWRVLTQPNTDLQEIVLCSYMGESWFRPDQDQTLLGALAPKLQSLTLYRVIIPWNLCTVPTLKSLSISFPYQFLSHHASTFLPTHAELLSIMASSPLLEYFHIVGIKPYQPPSSTALPRGTLKQLKELFIEALYSSAFCDFVERLDLPKTARALFTITAPTWPGTDSIGDTEVEHARLVSTMARKGLLQDCNLELGENSLRVSDPYHEAKVVRQRGSIDYEKAFKGFSDPARAIVISASISSMHCDNSRRPLEAIHSTFPEIRLLCFSMYRLGNGFGDWPGVLEDPRRKTNPALPKSLCSRLAEIEIDVDVVLDMDLSDVLSLIRARNSVGRMEKDTARPAPITRLRITAPSARLPAPQKTIWEEIEALVPNCHFEATNWEDDEEEAISSEAEREDDQDESSDDGDEVE